MDNIVKIEDLSFSYSDKPIFSKLNLEIKKSDFVTIAGFGKTTIVKILARLLPFSGIIKINNKDLLKNNKDLGIVSYELNEEFEKTIRENFIYNLKKQNINNEQINMEIKNIAKLFNIEELLDCSFKYLSSGEKCLLRILITLFSKPQVLILDESMNMLDEVTKEKLFKYLKKLNRENDLTIINLTNDLEEAIYSKRIILIDKQVELNKSIKDAFKDIKIYEKMKLEVPFMIDLSKKLKYYNLVEDVILDMNKMVDYLWK